MLFLTVSTKAAVTLGAILGASVAFMKNKDEILDIAVECLQKSANHLNNLRSNKRPMATHEKQAISSDTECKDAGEKSLHITPPHAKAENGFQDGNRAGTNCEPCRQFDSESDITTPECSDVESCFESEEVLGISICAQSSDTLQNTLEVVSID